VFDDVDVTVMVEKEVGGEKVPLPYVVRKTNEKSIVEIQWGQSSSCLSGWSPGWPKL
jgi:hypothetical protein